MKKKTERIKKRLRLLKPIITNPQSIRATRALQDEAGKIMRSRRVVFKKCWFDDFEACIASPRHAPEGIAILYLHGGGYTAGSLEYAKGFGSILAQRTGIDALCVGYRLAPENPFPAALDDALAAYKFLRTKYERVAFCGESAGGGLCYALCLKLKELGLPLPKCIVALSPWTDLTQTGPSYRYNLEKDPMLDRDNLRFSALSYGGDAPLDDPLISPLFGDLTGMPPSLIFAGSDEILLSDSEMLYEKLTENSCIADLTIAPGMWHVYILYVPREAADDLRRIVTFILERLKQ